MSKKEEFIREFIRIVKTDPESYFLESKWLPFADILNGNPKLRLLFREAVTEAEEDTKDPAQGLTQLFGPRE